MVWTLPDMARAMCTRMPALTMAMSSSRRWACLNSLTYSFLALKGMDTRSSTSWGSRATLRYPRKKSSALTCNKATSLLISSPDAQYALSTSCRI